MLLMELQPLWTAAVVLAGFQIAALTWRIRREIEMEDKGEQTWVTCADGFVVASLFVLIGGVFCGPALGVVKDDLAAKLFGLALVLFACAPLVLAGHYNLYCRWDKDWPRDRITKQEMAAISVAAFLPLGYGAWWAVSGFVRVCAN